MGGASVRITINADGGSNLQPVITLLDPEGGIVDTGATQQIGWLPQTNVAYHVTLPEIDGTYVARVGGASASTGSFWGEIAGSPGDSDIPEIPVSAVSGTVTDALTSEPIEGVTVLVDASAFATTDAAGLYSGTLEAGSYGFSFQANDYQELTDSLTVADGLAATLDAALIPTVPVNLEPEVSGSAVPGGVLTASVAIQAPPGTTIQSVVWTQRQGVTADIGAGKAKVGRGGGGTGDVSVTLAPLADYKEALIDHLIEPPVAAEELPPNVPLPPGEFPAGLQDRYQVVGINPNALEESGLVILEAEVTTSLGVFVAELDIETHLPWEPASGLHNVPIGDAVLLQAKEQSSYAWTMIPPSGSLATLMDADTQHPWFTPDIVGRYALEVSEGLRGGAITLDVYAGTFRGIIDGQDTEGRPVNTSCGTCHNDELASAAEFEDWAQTGHAEIFTNLLNSSSFYSSRCFSCHMVGYDPDTDNEGVDEAEDYQDFLTFFGDRSVPAQNWDEVLDQFPETARLANAQCDVCHGPTTTEAHGFAAIPSEPRVDISSDVCATCHGELPRHGRFQQWQLSGHANYELAIDESQSGSCSRCHTGNGFLAWLPILLDDDPNTDPTASIQVDWTEDESHPQTCVTCHDPHQAGTTSGSDPQRHGPDQRGHAAADRVSPPTSWR